MQDNILEFRTDIEESAYEWFPQTTPGGFQTVSKLLCLKNDKRFQNTSFRFYFAFFVEFYSIFSKKKNCF